ncbi:hypothetical protein PHYBLDRAFT_162764 [Phycomyces blakesleeanus NRRL 1555(-)]|uniref:Uncharacterized protein n=1 Tax=Phycomyces blakesleeanus (strain ATCC 8743b / DSM 1359 / FGSC 10004 / NBRC 33097 / NRRL 1555) TaxID=763407 RepID=A0A167QHK3_PHYB8|nr:hypothetical protein PHYBLDRAFT_162764 [Phycomyces blakesleeanus NRRL 1555(-)]OAD79707.1 hypothetical protein PHYBLDRAFT_162764 [Phycomyces blakesleeanus NRRL 1555(-)]|eukprot:XP_018297747.1 hypothetical protein PHYBLDRAFT_162764 [Phycomyces blakesleeanus NRRL 1555(-)]
MENCDYSTVFVSFLKALYKNVSLCSRTGNSNLFLGVDCSDNSRKGYFGGENNYISSPVDSVNSADQKSGTSSISTHTHICPYTHSLCSQIGDEVYCDRYITNPVIVTIVLTYFLRQIYNIGSWD